MNPVLERIVDWIRRYPIVAVSIVLTLALGGVNYFLWMRHRGLIFRHGEVRTAGDTMLDSVANQPRLEAQLRKLQEATTTIDANLVSGGDLAGNAQYFYEVQSVSRVRMSELSQMNSPAPNEGSPFIAVPFSLRATGTFRQLMVFLRELEEGPNLVKVDSYNLTRADPTGETLSLDLTVSLLGKP